MINKQQISKTHSEPTFAFHNIPDTSNILELVGYFQSWKFFEGFENEVRNDLTFSDESIEKASSRMSKDTVKLCLHVRWGDIYDRKTGGGHKGVENYNPVMTLKYYENALSYFDDDIPVIIFSDDPYWCNDQQLFESDRFIISYGQDTKIDLCLMTMCSYHIIANSSFSWWGSYLANSEKTIAPKLWFGDELSKVKSTQDLYLNNWIVI
jgi:hypothetical protein